MQIFLNFEPMYISDYIISHSSFLDQAAVGAMESPSAIASGLALDLSAASLPSSMCTCLLVPVSQSLIVVVISCSYMRCAEVRCLVVGVTLEPPRITHNILYLSH